MAVDESWLVPVSDNTDSSNVQLTIDTDDVSLTGEYDLTITISL